MHYKNMDLLKDLLARHYSFKHRTSKLKTISVEIDQFRSEGEVSLFSLVGLLLLLLSLTWEGEAAGKLRLLSW